MRRVATFTIVGAGGIGCAVGYALRASGARVRFVEADVVKVRWGREYGVRVDGRLPLTADFESFADWSPAPGDTVFLCTKCYDNPTVLARLPSAVTLVPIQNGFDRALDRPGAAPEGIASFVSECLPQRTHTRITRAGRLHLGTRGPENGAHSSVSVLAARLQRAGLFRVETVPDILPYKHTKLMYNAAIGPLAAAAGLDNGQLLALPAARRLFFQLLQENYAILRDAGVRLGKVGPFHPATVDGILRRTALANLLTWAFYPSLRGTYCSMYGDLPTGRTEIDYYNAYLIDLAGDRPCPLNRRVYATIKRLERERRVPGIEVLTGEHSCPAPGSPV
jgi:2-dehydropantoate 2-reductase